jgi:hypothetical protein
MLLLCPKRDATGEEEPLQTLPVVFYQLQHRQNWRRHWRWNVIVPKHISLNKYS